MTSDREPTARPFQGMPSQPFCDSKAPTPCCVCGRNVPSVTWRARVVMDGGYRFAMPDEVVDEARDLGGFPVGSECRKKLGRYAIPAEEVAR